MSKRKPFSIALRNELVQFLSTAELFMVESGKGLGTTVMFKSANNDMWLFNSCSRGRRTIFNVRRKDENETISCEMKLDNGVIDLRFGSHDTCLLLVHLYFKTTCYSQFKLHGEWLFEVATVKGKTKRIIAKVTK